MLEELGMHSPKMIRKNIPEKVEMWDFILMNTRLNIIEYNAWEEKSYGAQGKYKNCRFVFESGDFIQKTCVIDK